MAKDLVEEKKEIPEIIEIPVDNPAEIKTEKKIKAAPKKYTKKSQDLGNEEITALLVGVFGLVALKAGEHWVIDETEAKQISQPLVNILKKINIMEEVSNVSDGMMLVLAVGILTIPRIMISIDIAKTKKIEVQKKDERSTMQNKQVRDSKIENVIDIPGASKIESDDLYNRQAIFEPDLI